MLCRVGDGERFGLMDDQKVQPGFPGDRSQAAAQKLRALRERANHALDDHRRRLNELESQLSQRVKQLADDYDAEGEAKPNSVAGHDTEIAELRRQLEEGRLKHEKFVEQLAAARKQLDALQSQPCQSCQQASAELAEAQQQLLHLHDELDTTTRHLQEERARHDKFAEQLAQARQALNELKNASGDRATELSSELAAARAAEDKLDAQLAAARRDLEIAQLELDAQASKAVSLEHELAKARDEAQAANQEQLRRIEELEAHSRADQAEIAQLEQRVDALTADGQSALDAESSLLEQVESLEARLAQSQNEVAEVRREFEQVQGELTRAQATLDEATRDKDRVEEESRKLDEALAALKSSADAAQHEMAQGLAQTQAEVAELCIQLATTDGKKVAAEKSLAEAIAQCEALARNMDELEVEKQKADAAIFALRASADSSHVKLIADLSLAQSEAAKLREELEARQAENQSLEQSASESAAAQRELRSTLEAATRQLDTLRSEVAEAARLRTELDRVQAEHATAQAEISELRSAADSNDELAQLQQKFDLALADVQKLKRDNASLREELDRRPEVNSQESAELIAVRSERDELTRQVAELAAKAAQPVDADAQQDRADLQRRFEMAVDDVRQLKQENAQLRDRLAAASKAQPAAAASTGPMDWAAQRAKLMAMLEEEDQDGPPTGARKTERATIDGTIHATDRIVAEKDEEITKLRAALEGQCGKTAAATVDRDSRAMEEILDRDDLIATERRRLAEMQAAWEDTARKAELEISLERAKLAREQAALRERAMELQMIQPMDPAPAEGSPAAPRRRWLAALGLGDDADEQKKKK